jgi:hypothetical protein
MVRRGTPRFLPVVRRSLRSRPEAGWETLRFLAIRVNPPGLLSWARGPGVAAPPAVPAAPVDEFRTRREFAMEGCSARPSQPASRRVFAFLPRCVCETHASRIRSAIGRLGPPCRSSARISGSQWRRCTRDQALRRRPRVEICVSDAASSRSRWRTAGRVDRVARAGRLRGQAVLRDVRFSKENQTYCVRPAHLRWSRDVDLGGVLAGSPVLVWCGSLPPEWGAG